MTNLLQTGLAWLTDQKKAHASTLVTYTRDGVGSVSVYAELGHKLLRVTDNNGNVRTERTELDVGIKAVDLTPGGSAAEPQKGDHIDVTLDNVLDRYDVMPLGNEPAWKYADPFKTRFRIHAKHIATAATPTISSFTPSVIISGTSVVITGTNFVGVTFVKFNGVEAASFTVNSTTKITAVAPVTTDGTIAVLALGGTATSAASFTYPYLYDLFAGAADTNLTAHAMDAGAGWSAGSGSMTLDGSGKAQTVTLDAHAKYLAESGQFAVTVTADLVVTGGVGFRQGGLIARAVDANSHWWFYLDVVNQAAILYEVSGGVATERDTEAVTITGGATYAVKLVCSGNVITGYVDGVQKVQFTSAFNNAATQCGLSGFRSAGNTVKWDNFKVAA